MTINFSSLQELALGSLQLSYNVDAPDTLSLSVTPEVYDEQLALPEADRMLPVSPGERLTVTEGGEVVFSGTLPTGVQFEYEAGSAARVNIELQSDYNLLDRIVFSKLDSNGEALFPGSLTPTRTTTLNAVVNTIDNWVGGYIPSDLACDVSGKVPTPQSDGTASCASLLNEAMRWVPDTVMVQRYGASNTLLVTTPDKLGSLVLDPNQRAMQSLSVQERDDLRVPVAALVGGAKGKWPSGVDIRTPGAFVYAVPVDKDAPEAAAQRGGAGSSPASSKMVVRGVQLPEAKTYERSVDEYNTDPYSADSQVQKFIKRFFPELAPLQQVACAGSCFINVMSESDFLEELKEDDENAQLPNNYQEASALWGNSVYVLTEGSFPASPHNRKNVKGLRWCKAQLHLVVSVKANTQLSAEVRKLCQEFLPGRRVTKSGNSFYYVRKTLSCILINRRKRVYDPATARLCSDDPSYNEEEPDEPSDDPTAVDYAAAMEQYQRAASVPQYEGSVSLLHDGTIRPWELTGKLLSVINMRPEWAGMNAVIRSVSWDYQQRKLSISFGPRSVMGFSELLERRLMGRNISRDAGMREALAYDPADPEAQQAAEEAMSVSPSISAGVDSTSTGRWHKPFTLYIREDAESETSSVVMAGGTIRKFGQTFHIEDSDQQISDGQPNGKPWSYGSTVQGRVWRRVDGTYTYDIFQK